MRRKVSVIIVFFLLSGLLAFCADPGRVSYGVKWGWCPQVASYEHCNFRSDVGSRVEDKNFSFTWNNNLEASVFAEYFITGSLGAGISVGIEGYTDNKLILPVSVRLRIMPSCCKGFFALAEGGYARCLDGYNVIPARLYFGFRQDLGAGISLDAMLGAKMNMDCAPYYDDSYYGRISAERIVYKYCFSACVGFSLAICF